MSLAPLVVTPKFAAGESDDEDMFWGGAGRSGGTSCCKYGEVHLVMPAVRNHGQIVRGNDISFFADLVVY